MDLGHIGQQVRDNVVADLISKAILALVGVGVAGVVLVVTSGASVPAWTLVAAIVVLGSGAALLLHDKNASADVAWWAVEIQEQCLQHLAQTLDTLQHVLTDAIDGANIGNYIDHGILAPAKDMLTRDPEDHVRLSILAPDGDTFRMRFFAGHNLTSARRFSIPIKDSISRVAFESGLTQTWDNVSEDDRYLPHPKATRPTGAMVSVPLTRGDAVIGVFNAISDRSHGFSPGDRLYIECLGSVIDVAIGILNANTPRDRQQRDLTP